MGKRRKLHQVVFSHTWKTNRGQNISGGQSLSYHRTNTPLGAIKAVKRLGFKKVKIKSVNVRLKNGWNRVL